MPNAPDGPRGEATLRTIAMPADTNPFGDIFGGWLMGQMDLAGGSHAMQLAGGRVATVGVAAMSFHLPVYVGDLVTSYCDTVSVGTTSITVHVQIWVRRKRAGGLIKVTEGDFTYVALDDQGNKRAIAR